MKLKTQEKIRLLEMFAMIGVGGLTDYLIQCPDNSFSQSLIHFFIDNDIPLADISFFIKNLYMVDCCTSFRTQRLTEDYNTLKKSYNCIIKNICGLFNKLGISDSPIKIFAVYVYMYRSGYLSYNKSFEYSIDMKDFAGLSGVDVIRGSGVCRSISSMLTDIYSELGYESYNLSVNASDESIKKLQKLSSVSLQKSNKGSKFAKFVGKVTKNLPIANHLITMVREKGVSYKLDPTNDGWLCNGFNNKLVTYDDPEADMKNYFWESLMMNILGMYNDGINIFKQRKIFDMPTFDDKTCRNAYLEALQLCVDSEDLFVKFYEENKSLIDEVYNISSNQSDLIRRLIPIIPKTKNK